MITTVPDVASIVNPVIKFGLADDKVTGFDTTKAIAELGTAPALEEPVKVAAPVVNSKDIWVKLYEESMVNIPLLNVYVQNDTVVFAILAILCVFNF